MWLAAAQRLFRPSCVSASATIVHQPQRLAPQTARLARWTARSATSKRPAITQLCRAQYDDRQQWSPSPPRPRDDTYLANPQQQAGNGVFVLLLINLLIFLADKVLHLPIIKALYLYHASPQWYQHLSTNMFMLLVFGRYVEEEGGVLGLWLTYLICGLGGALASYFSSPSSYTVSLGASGAIFGLFAVGVLSKLSFHPRKLLEAFVLGQFVVSQVLQEVAAQAAAVGGSYGGSQVSHVAHLGGAAAGVMLMWALSKLPEAEGGR